MLALVGMLRTTVGAVALIVIVVGVLACLAVLNNPYVQGGVLALGIGAVVVAVLAGLGVIAVLIAILDELKALRGAVEKGGAPVTERAATAMPPSSDRPAGDLVKTHKGQNIYVHPNGYRVGARVYGTVLLAEAAIDRDAS